MGALQKIVGFVAGFALLQGVYAALDASSNSTVVVYWGQNSFNGSGDLAQQRLGYYCDDSNIDVIVMAFLMTIDGAGGVPEIDFATTTKDCDVFPGTNLKNCPEIGEDIQKCQSKGKTIILSIGGAIYTEGGFSSQSAADAGADLIWKTFGPDQGDSKVHRPFGKAVIDGFDFDFEAAVENTGAFAMKLRALADKDTSKKYYLTAAPQCPYPDAADKDILNTDASAAIDMVFVQFYNNYCGLNAYTAAREVKRKGKKGGKEKHSRGLYGTPHGVSAHRTAAQTSFNFDVWDKWALTESKNKNVRVFLGVPANTGAASTGYLPASSLAPVIAYSKGFESFGGVMMWDVTQAYGNKGFLDGVQKALAAPAEAHGSSSSSSPPQEENADASDSPSPQPVTKPSQADDEQHAQDQPSQTQTQASQSSAAAPAEPAQGQSTGEQQQNQDSGADQDADEGSEEEDEDRPMNLLPSLLGDGADLDFLEI